MVSSRIILYILFLLLSCSFAANAQRYSITRFTSKDGLAQNKCRVMMKDFRGNIWIGTQQGGVSKFDGQKFTNYSTRDGLADNFIYGIVQDSLKNVWIATGNGLSKYNGDRFTNFLTSDESRILISAITIDSKQNIWFFQKGKGLGKMDDQGSIEYVYYPSLNTKTVNALYTDSQDRVWIATDSDGAYMYNGEWQHYNVEQGINTAKTFSFLETSEGDILLGTALGVNIFRGKNFGQFDDFAFLNPLSVTHLAEDHKGRFWFATPRGAWVYNRKTIKQLTEVNGLTQQIFGIQTDNEDGIFFASSEGLYRWDNELFAIYDIEHGLIGERIYSCAANSDSSVWISTENGINLIKNGEATSPENFPYEFLDYEDPIVTDSSDILYLGSSASIYIYDGKTFEAVFREDELRENERFTCGLVARNQEVFFGGNNGVCLYKEGRLTTYLPQRLLKGFEVSTLLEDPNGNLLVGTNGGGVFRYRKGKLEQFAKRKGFPNGVINAMLYDDRGNLWLGTTGNGIMKVPNGDFTKDVVTFDDLDLASSNVYSLLKDNDGNLWVGTDRGLSRIRVLQNDYVKVINYLEKEGFTPLEVYPNAACINKDGSLWIGTIEGVVKVNPNEEAYTLVAPKVYFEGLNLYFETVQWKDYTDSIDTWTGMPQNLVLPNDKNHLQFKFVGVSMNLPSEVTYQWQLEGLDASWTPPSIRSEAIYTNVPPGTYTFRVKACNSGGICNDQPTEFQFEINKPFYQTRAFFVSMLLLLGGVLYFVFRARLQQLEKAKYQLQLKVRERTTEIETQKAEIEAQSDKLEQAITEIEEKNSALKKASEETVNSLTYAGRIQSAILSYKKEFAVLFPQSFVFNINRRIVTGDFIWLKEKRAHIYVAMVDCTGSGVPAAFMSIIGYDFLNEAIDDCEDDSPASLLDYINKKVISALHVDGNTDLNDGMDIAILKIDRSSREMVFAGARRSIVFVDSNQKVETIKGEFFSVGINYSGVETKFKEHSIQLEEGTTIYLFSDGFANQFNEQGKKYKSSNFRKLLSEASQYDMNMQMNLLKEEFYRWKGDTELLDDVFVAGFKID